MADETKTAADREIIAGLQEFADALEAGDISGFRQSIRTADGMRFVPETPLTKAAAAMLAVLKRLEWCDEFDGHIGLAYVACPCCDAYREDGHDTDCALAAAIRAAEGRG